MDLLTRTAFREGVFKRDGGLCVICNALAQDAHHIMERRLWPDGGYYLDNGAALCGPCHLLAESTEISCEEIREAANIKTILLPPHLYRDASYDKWGNIIYPDGTRSIGELYYDESVYKVLEAVRDVFVSTYIKYPRTYHMPSSPGKTKDDRVLRDLSRFYNKEVVITEKMDGENTTIYPDSYTHARSIDSRSHPSRSWVKNLSAQMYGAVPKSWRICGENLWAKHSIGYDNLESYFLGFSIWNRNVCLNWDSTVEWFELLTIPMVPLLYKGPFRQDVIDYYGGSISKERNDSLIKQEGFVMRLADSFTLADFRFSVAKWVRANHVQSSHHWMRETITRNHLCQR